MSTIGMVLTVILMILAVILAAIILMQSKRSAGLGAVSGNSSDTYWSKNKGNSVEGAYNHGHHNSQNNQFLFHLRTFLIKQKSPRTHPVKDTFMGVNQ